MPPAATKVKFQRVIDGDTVEVSQPKGFLRSPDVKSVRLYGIDAPETSQKGSQESTQYLARLIGSRKNLWMEERYTDQYGRAVAILSTSKNKPDRSYNYQMVRDGQAYTYMTTGPEAALYTAAQEEARRKNRGVWKKPTREKPWEYRQLERQKAKKHANSARRVKLILAAATIAAGLYFLWSTQPW